MKKITATVFTIICLVLLLVACGKIEPKVTFIVDNETYQVVKKSEINNVVAPEKEGYIFEGWFFDKNEWEKPLKSEDVLKNCTVYAKFRKSNELLFEFDCSSEYNIEKSAVVLEGKTIDLPLIESSQNFLGWVDEDGNGPFKKIVAAKNSVFKPIFGNLERIYIDTNGAPILDKENYVDATFTMMDKDGEIVNDFKDLKTGIRLRGNYTFQFNKKPYRLKFEKKQALLGENKYKSWVLLADTVDPTLMKNYSAHYLASQMDGIGVQLRTKHVEVFVNGVEMGVYLLTDQVQEQPEGSIGRVPIEIDEEELATMTEVPFLIEKDHYMEGEENRNWFKYRFGGTDYNVQIKYPEEPTSEQFNFIYGTYDKACKLFEQLDKSSKEEKSSIREQIESIVDIDSVIDYFLVLQMIYETDSGGSGYIYYDMDKIKYGPIWDCDGAFYTVNTGNSRFEKNYDNVSTELAVEDDWYSVLRRDSEFNSRVCDRFNDAGKKAMENMLEHLGEYFELMYYDGMRNIILWGEEVNKSLPGANFITEYKNYGKYSGAKTYVITWFERRLEFLTQLFEIN